LPPAIPPSSAMLRRMSSRCRDQLLALGDDLLVEHVATRLLQRGLAADGDTLSQVEHEVMLADLAFRTISSAGVDALVQDFADDLPSMREALRALGLRRHADVVGQLLACAPDISRADLAAAWAAIDDDATARVAAYLRMHADGVAWQRLI
jgi:hypothetical protein